MTVKSNSKRFKAKVCVAAIGVATRGAEAIIEEATSLILESSKTGRVYRRRGTTHQASAPGEAPASDTGRLVQSRRTEVDTRKDGTVIGAATWSTAYAAGLEYGNENVEPRPFARPALANKKDEIIRDLQRELLRAAGHI